MGRSQEDFEEEIRSHLQLETDNLIAEGLTPAAAAYEARRRFGNVGIAQDRFHDARRFAWLEDLLGDVRLTLRGLRRHRLFGANVITIAALGIVACVTTFSIVSGILLKPLPFRDPSRVALLQLRSAEGSSGGIPMDFYRRIAAGSPVIEAIGSGSPGSTVFEHDNRPEHVRIERITPSYLRVFGISPVLGRGFDSLEAAAREPVVMLGHDTWRSRFGGDSGVVGRAVSLDGGVYRVIGVMPSGFRATRATEPAFWLPTLPGVSNSGRPLPTTNAIVRIKPEVSVARAEEWLRGIGTVRVESILTTDSVTAVAGLVPVADLLIGSLRQPLYMLLSAVALVLLLVTANIATLFLVRSTARMPEFAVRRALGASTGRQLRQVVTESLVLTAIGGVLGTIASYWLVAAVRGLGTGVLPRMELVALDWRVLVFGIAATVVAGVVAGIVPALSTVKPTSTAARATSRYARVSSSLVIAQTSFSVLLLVAAGLLTKSFLRVLPDEPGFALENRATVSLRLPDRGALQTSDRASVDRFIQHVTDRMRAVDGVAEVAVSTYLPFIRVFSLVDVDLPGESTPAKRRTAFYNPVSANFFSVIELPIRLGRALHETDRAGTGRVAVINETAAKTWWPGRNPIGRTVHYTEARQKLTAVVVGVAGDARLIGSDTRIRPEMYVPLAQASPSMLSFIARTAVPPRLVAERLKQALWSVAPGVPIESTSDLSTIASRSVSTSRFFALALSIFAVAAIVLTALGVHAVLAFGVVQRRREIGIRIALGASRGRVIRSILRHAVIIGLAGIAIGIVAARGLTRLLESILLEVTPTDLPVFALGAVAALAVAIGSGCIPAWRAARSDPLEAIRHGE